jgi:hypothetical protein
MKTLSKYGLVAIASLVTGCAAMKNQTEIELPEQTVQYVKNLGRNCGMAEYHLGVRMTEIRDSLKLAEKTDSINRNYSKNFNAVNFMRANYGTRGTGYIMYLNMRTRDNNLRDVRDIFENVVATDARAAEYAKIIQNAESRMKNLYKTIRREPRGRTLARDARDRFDVSRHLAFERQHKQRTIYEK